MRIMLDPMNRMRRQHRKDGVNRRFHELSDEVRKRPGAAQEIDRHIQLIKTMQKKGSQ